ncbi:hypothetical protein LXL04_039062 [Taraxacum kok-saghyz]
MMKSTIFSATPWSNSQNLRALLHAQVTQRSSSGAATANVNRSENSRRSLDGNAYKSPTNRREASFWHSISHAEDLDLADPPQSRAPIWIPMRSLILELINTVHNPIWFLIFLVLMMSTFSSTHKNLRTSGQSDAGICVHTNSNVVHPSSGESELGVIK